MNPGEEKSILKATFDVWGFTDIYAISIIVWDSLIITNKAES
jgi:hypothetical protein